MRKQREERRRSESLKRKMEQEQLIERENRYEHLMTQIRKIQIAEAEYQEEYKPFEQKNSQQGGKKKKLSMDLSDFTHNERCAVKIFFALNRIFKRIYFDTLKKVTLFAPPSDDFNEINDESLENAIYEAHGSYENEYNYEYYQQPNTQSMPAAMDDQNDPTSL